MCGIWSSLGLLPSRRAIDIVAHRGPDGDGWKQFQTPAGPLTLGHRRLAIIALDSSGAQPMAYERDRFTIVFNGEIYNYRELRDELGQLGRELRTQSDTEVLLAAYAQWGSACLARFNGMFAFAIFDNVAQTLFVARDRFGVKPLYYWIANSGVAFASEIKQFTTLPEFRARLDSEGAREYLVSGVTDHQSGTLFAGVSQLRGGECATINLATWSAGHALQVTRWYHLPQPDSRQVSLEEAGAEFLSMLRDSVRLRLHADVPVGTCLSGGLDSSAIACLMNELIAADPNAQQHTFTCAFDEPGLDEWSYAQAVVEKCGATSHVVSPGAEDFWRNVDDVIWHQDEPFGSTSIFAQWAVFSEAHAAGVTVMLDGQGADEQLAGYHTMFGAAIAGSLLRFNLSKAVHDLAAIRRRHRISYERLAGLVLASLMPRTHFSKLVALAGRRGPLRYLRREFASRASGSSPALHAPTIPGATPLGSMCADQLTTSSVPMLLRFEDRNSMAHSIEARVPFLDFRVAELTIALGEANKLVDGETKALMRRAMTSVVPDSILRRQDKLGFPTPEEAWFKGPLRSRILADVASAVEAHPHIFSADEALQFATDTLDGRIPFSFALWRIACFGRWGERFSVAA